LISNETNIPAKKQKNEAGARFYEEDAHQERTGYNQAAPGKRAQETERLNVGKENADTSTPPEKI
jgi:hypothetical protein